MNTPWIDVTTCWIPGTAFGVLAGVLGAVSGVLASRGRSRTMVLCAWRLFLLASLLLLVVGIAAKLQDQPYHVWYALGFPGLLGLLILVPNYFVVRSRYRESEMRKIDAGGLR